MRAGSSCALRELNGGNHFQVAGLGKLSAKDQHFANQSRHAVALQDAAHVACRRRAEIFLEAGIFDQGSSSVPTRTVSLSLPATTTPTVRCGWSTLVRSTSARDTPAGLDEALSEPPGTSSASRCTYSRDWGSSSPAAVAPTGSHPDMPWPSRRWWSPLSQPSSRGPGSPASLRSSVPNVAGSSNAEMLPAVFKPVGEKRYVGARAAAGTIRSLVVVAVGLAGRSRPPCPLPDGPVADGRVLRYTRWSPPAPRSLQKLQQQPGRRDEVDSDSWSPQFRMLHASRFGPSRHRDRRPGRGGSGLTDRDGVSPSEPVRRRHAHARA